MLMWLNVRGFSAALTEDAALADDGGRRRDDRVGGGARRHCDRALLVRPAWQPGRRVAVRASPRSARWRCRSRPVAGGRAAGADCAPTARAAGRRAPRAGPRVSMLLLDGASLDYILPRVAGRPPAGLRALLDKGAVMDLATRRPTQPDPVWAAVATGMYPAKNGVRSAGRYYARGDDARRRPASGSLLLARAGAPWIHPRPTRARRPLAGAAALGRSLSRPGSASAWCAGRSRYPAEPLNGFIVSDRFHQLRWIDRGVRSRGIAAATSCRSLQRVFGCSRSDAAVGRSDAAASRRRPKCRPCAATGTTRRDRAISARGMRRRASPRFVTTGSIRSVMTTCGDTQPRTFRDVPDEERRRYSQAIDALLHLHRR